MTASLGSAPRTAPGQWTWFALALGGLTLVATGAAASTGAGTNALPNELTARFDPVARQTQVRERVAEEVCVSFDLEREWSLVRLSDGTTLRAPSGDDLDIHLRSAAELRAFPQPDIGARDAAALQESYEELIGKPAQAVDYRPTALPGVTRWSATWIDPNSEGPSHTFAFETFIVDVNGSFALELTMNAGDESTYRIEIAHMLDSLRVTTGPECRDRPIAGR